ncbi:hypothetical protein Ahy_B10g101951 [Arachis hypogaea]|uniref:Protein FAR1-RELATED SEQUENCE n=1 Tax=Arachis hypogaea TaxID=3818 RepID=A0A444X0Q2_ARAHY|nr:hypothetical protein Ahy_B10g101951 [Arachis hypogaea]
MSTSQVEGVSSVLALPPPSPRQSSLMECIVAEPVVCFPSPGGNEISLNPNENIDKPLVVDPVQITKATQMLDVTDIGSDEMDTCDELPDHGSLEEDEIPSVEMRFAKLQLAHDFYVSYTKKVGFATKIMTTTFDKITKEFVNQAIHCNRDRIRGSRVKAPTRKNPILAIGCKARIYVKFDKEKQDWLFFKHGLPFASFVGVNHHGKSTLLGCALLENEEISSYEWVFTQWVTCMGTAPQCIIIDQCRSMYGAIRKALPNTHHRWCIWHIMKKFSQKLRGYCRYREFYADIKDIIFNSRTEESFEKKWFEFIEEYNLYDNTWLSSFSPMERQFQQEYTTSMFRDVQVEFVKKAYCRASVVTKDGPVVCMKVEEEKSVHDNMLCVSYVVHFDRSTQEVRCECNLFESSGVMCCHCLEVFHSFKVYKVHACYVLPRLSKNLKRKHTYIKSSHDRLCAHFYNIAQEFVNDDDETTLLHAALEETRAKLSEHHAKKRSESMAETHTSIGSQNSNVLGLVDIQRPSWSLQRAGQRVRGSERPLRSLSTNLVGGKTRMFPRYMLMVRSNTYQDTNIGDPIARNAPEQVGSFMSLLSSFDKKLFPDLFHQCPRTWCREWVAFQPPRRQRGSETRSASGSAALTIATTRPHQCATHHRQEARPRSIEDSSRRLVAYCLLLVSRQSSPPTSLFSARVLVPPALQDPSQDLRLNVY